MKGNSTLNFIATVFALTVIGIIIGPIEDTEHKTEDAPRVSTSMTLLERNEAMCKAGGTELLVDDVREHGQRSSFFTTAPICDDTPCKRLAEVSNWTNESDLVPLAINEYTRRDCAGLEQQELLLAAQLEMGPPAPSFAELNELACRAGSTEELQVRDQYYGTEHVAPICENTTCAEITKILQRVYNSEVLEVARAWYNAGGCYWKRASLERRAEAEIAHEYACAAGEMINDIHTGEIMPICDDTPCEYLEELLEHSLDPSLEELVTHKLEERDCRNPDRKSIEYPEDLGRWLNMFCSLRASRFQAGYARAEKAGDQLWQRLWGFDYTFNDLCFASSDLCSTYDSAEAYESGENDPFSSPTFFTSYHLGSNKCVRQEYDTEDLENLFSCDRHADMMLYLHEDGLNYGDHYFEWWAERKRMAFHRMNCPGVFPW